MSKRLQVVLSDKEHRELKRLAQSQDMTLSEWVRSLLREAKTRSPGRDPKQKLTVIRRAAEHDFPSPDIEQMNAEISAGYASGWTP